ncbi:EF hand domain containing protein [Acanthamoeba castellanii str. Neff]|uniref:EF hand domain containing protein n=1 Tax=Acanthamoeba castellanii (strain ATCC 30010 / Neff) TaxID=1257118 RepID=L8HAR9_ACACF|nr:EF hand domain containing protein [Acanthamoeba castellanii str. Neff]ELR22352.1 EF hand domain containing protein [Acanthamoeba castellanii str. Neff]
MSVEELREVFDQFDENGDGQLSLEEFAQAFRAFGEPDKEVHAAFKKCDKDGNQSIDFDEFVSFFNEADDDDKPEVNESALKALFKAFDEDGNGKLSKQELVKAFKAWGHPITETEEEFKKMMLE